MKKPECRVFRRFSLPESSLTITQSHDWIEARAVDQVDVFYSKSRGIYYGTTNVLSVCAETYVIRKHKTGTVKPKDHQEALGRLYHALMSRLAGEIRCLLCCDQGNFFLVLTQAGWRDDLDQSETRTETRSRCEPREQEDLYKGYLEIRPIIQVGKLLGRK